MTVTAQQVKDTFPEFAQVTDARVELWLDQAGRRINATQWSEKTDDGTLWLTAHLLSIDCQLRSGAGAAPGPISQKKVGEVWVTYSIPSALTKSALSMTTYGQYYLDLKTAIWPTRVLGDCSS